MVREVIGWIHPDGTFGEAEKYHEEYAQKVLGLTTMQALSKGFLLVCSEVINQVFTGFILQPEEYIRTKAQEETLYRLFEGHVVFQS